MIRKQAITEETFYYVKYARVSTDSQASDDSISIDYQLSRIEQWVQQQQAVWICVGEFKEDSSGFEYERVEMNSIWELAKQHKINAIVVLRRNRFARGEAASVILEQHFKKNDVRLFSVESGEFTPGKTNRIVSAVERAQAEESAEEQKKNMREKRYAYIENGAHPSQGPALYGYTKVGKKATSRYVIEETEADVVRLIFALYLERHSFEEIAAILNNEGIPQPSARMTRDGSRQMKHKHEKKGWTKFNVRHIVHMSDSYKGTHTIYRHTVREDAPDQMTIEIPAIIDEGTYQRVSYLREQTRHVFFKTNEGRTFLYVGRITCKCGYSFSGSKVAKRSKKTNETHGYNYYYRCNSTFDKNSRGECDVRYMNADKVEAVIWHFISEILTDPRTAIERHKRQEKDAQKYLDNAIAHLESIDEIIAELNGEREQLITLFKKRFITEDRLDADIIVIDRQVEKLLVERNKWAAIIAESTIAESQIRDLESIAAAIRDRLLTIDLDAQRTILDKLRVKVTASREDGIIVLYVSILGSVPERLETVVSDESSGDDMTRERVKVAPR